MMFFLCERYFTISGLTIRAELYSEFWTINFICDFDQVDPSIASDSASAIFPFAKDLHDIYKIITARFGGRLGREIADPIPKEDLDRLKEIRRTLHKRFRDLIHDNIISPCIETQAGASRERLGGLFAEFHGAVLGVQPGAKALECIEVGSNFPSMPKTIPAQIGKLKYSVEVATGIVDAMWPLIKEIQRNRDDQEAEEKRYGKPEFTVSLLQDQRSIYISSLGWLDPKLVSQEARPIVYTIVVSYHSRWPLGRLIERLHGMETS